MARFSRNEKAGIVYDPSVTITLGTLAAAAAITANSKIDGSRLNGFRVLKSELWIGASGKTTGEGPVVIGLAFDADAANVALAMAADPQADGRQTGDKVANTEAKFPVFPIAMIGKAETKIGIESVTMKHTLKPQWSAPEGSGLQYFAFNADTGALTTGTVVEIFAKHFGVWLND